LVLVAVYAHAAGPQRVDEHEEDVRAVAVCEPLHIRHRADGARVCAIAAELDQAGGVHGDRDERCQPPRPALGKDVIAHGAAKLAQTA